jgi:phosphate:Na+ symporter
MGGVEAAAAQGSIDVVLVVVTLLGGLAIFLLGLDQLTDSLKIVAGNQMRTVVERFTNNRFAGLATGAGVTALIQSSSATTVLVVGFISSGLMTLGQSIPVMLGADVGTTITAQIIAFDVGRYALGVVAAGFAISAISRRSHRMAQGIMMMGLGLVFYGMTVMGDAMDPLRTSALFVDLMASLDNPLVALAVSAAFTALIQSSAATAGIVIVLASNGLITLEAGIALILGANIGTTVTALLASIGKPRDALRAAIAHTLFKVIGVLIWVGLIDVLADWVRAIGGGSGREVANAHTIFNVANALLFIGFSTQFASLVRRLVPDRPGRALIPAKYLDEAMLKSPPLALSQARREMLRMATRARTMLVEALPAVIEGDPRALAEVEEIDDEIDALHGQIAAYLARIGELRLTEAAGSELIGLMEATNDLEAIGDIIETNLVGLGRVRFEQNITVSRQTRVVLEEFHGAVLQAFDLAMTALAEGDGAAAAEAIGMKRDVNTLEQATLAHEAERLRAPEPNRVATYRFEVDVIANLKRIYYFSKRIARAGVPPAARPEI